jgi:hypothetical protein
MRQKRLSQINACTCVHMPVATIRVAIGLMLSLPHVCNKYIQQLSFCALLPSFPLSCHCSAPLSLVDLLSADTVPESRLRQSSLTAELPREQTTDSAPSGIPWPSRLWESLLAHTHLPGLAPSLCGDGRYPAAIGEQSGVFSSVKCEGMPVYTCNQQGPAHSSLVAVQRLWTSRRSQKVAPSVLPGSGEGLVQTKNMYNDAIRCSYAAAVLQT